MLFEIQLKKNCFGEKEKNLAHNFFKEREKEKEPKRNDNFESKAKGRGVINEHSNSACVRVCAHECLCACLHGCEDGCTESKKGLVHNIQRKE